MQAEFNRFNEKIDEKQKQNKALREIHAAVLDMAKATKAAANATQATANATQAAAKAVSDLLMMP